MNSTSKARFFIGNENNFFQLVTFDQSSDGSIYCGFGPAFPRIRWQTLSVNKDNIHFVMESIPSDGKLSIHGTGMTAFRPHDNPKGHRLVIHGSPLIDDSRSTLGIRHLFTLYPEKPTHLPNSPASSRKSDYVIKTDQINPFVIVFFAIPATRLKVELRGQFKADEMLPGCPILGCNTVRLRHHLILWFIYRTRYMDRWPKNSYVCYQDGFRVPMYIGAKHQGAEGYATFTLNSCEPVYELSGEKVRIFIDASYDPPLTLTPTQPLICD